MEENNKLIAEFMGAEKTHIKSVGDIYCPVPSKNGSEYADKLQYHTSWDWLMPVIDKCYQEHMSKHISDAVMTCNIDRVYQVVVEFIKENNQNN
jgi:hypothetical protein